MSRDIDPDGRLTKDDLVYLAQRGQIPERYKDRIDMEQLGAILRGEAEISSLKLTGRSSHDEGSKHEEASERSE
jgi:hypothetical protein